MNSSKSNAKNPGSPTRHQPSSSYPCAIFTENIEHTPTPRPASTPTTATLRCSNHLNPAKSPRFNNVWLISQEAINSLIIKSVCNSPPLFTTLKLRPKYNAAPNLKHYALAMEHSITGKHITSYCKLMQDPATSDIWMRSFEKDFGGMCQGDSKTGTKGTNAIFVMEPKEVPNIPKDQPPTNAKVILSYHPQKEDPYRIRITVRGNLINSSGELTTCTANMTTTKLDWNSVLSTPKVRYM
jgi:hypothetical protein